MILYFVSFGISGKYGWGEVEVSELELILNWVGCIGILREDDKEVLIICFKFRKYLIIDWFGCKNYICFYLVY